MNLTILYPGEAIKFVFVRIKNHLVFACRGCEAIVRERRCGVEIERKDTVISFEYQYFFLFVLYQKLWF